MIAIPPAGLIAAMFVAQIVGMASFVTFPGLMPIFLEEWTLSNAEAGWISGVFFAGFVGAAPLLTAATDRVDPRRIFLAGIAAGALANIGFAASADGLWTGTFWRLVQGVAFAGTYMPGLRAVSDAVPEGLRNRAVAFYTATFTVGASFSFLVSGIAIAALSWRAVFYVMAAGPAIGFVLAFLFLPRRTAPPASGGRCRSGSRLSSVISPGTSCTMRSRPRSARSSSPTSPSRRRSRRRALSAWISRPRSSPRSPTCSGCRESFSRAR
jgi:MFS family permease